MSIKISELTVEQTTILDGDKQELSTETSPGVWESRFYTVTNLMAKVKTWAFGDWVVTNLTTNDDLHVPTVKAVVDGIAAASGVQSVSGTTVDNTDPLNPIVNVPTLQQVVDAGADTTTQPTINGINIATINDVVGSPVPISRIDLDALITGGTLALNTCYSVPSAIGIKQYLVWSNTVSSLYSAAIQVSDGRFGTYDFPIDNFTQMSGGAAWGGITGTLSSQPDLQIALDGKVDENTPITGATKTKVTYDAKGLVIAGADATTADIADSTNKRYVTDANLTTIGFISVTQAVDLDTIESDTVINNAKVSNATHTGEVTGSGALTVDKTAITNKAIVTAASGDKILIADISDSENLKYVTAQSIANLAGGALISGTAVVNFGSENDWATLTIANASITTSAIKNISIIPIETSTTSLDDFAINNVTFGIENIIDNTSFDVRGIAGNNASGNYTVNYLITI
jgi:hypothetical protein